MQNRSGTRNRMVPNMICASEVSSSVMEASKLFLMGPHSQKGPIVATWAQYPKLHDIILPHYYKTITALQNIKSLCTAHWGA